MGFDEALDIVSTYAVRSGFRPDMPKPVVGAAQLPADAKLWISSYAQLLIIPCKGLAVEELVNVARNGQEWIDLTCQQRESETPAVFDGYLLIHLPQRPPFELTDCIRQIELDPRACRKHVAWPEDGEAAELRWLRVFRVTVSGLPSSPTSTGMPGSPILSSALETRLMEKLRGASSPKQVALEDSEQAADGDADADQ